MDDGIRRMAVEIQQPPDVPKEWVQLISKLHPITAVVVWEVLTNRLSPATISLAQYSPDWERYIALQIVGGGNAAVCDDVAQIARLELDEIFTDLLPGHESSQVLQ